jgi:hypothetical protein
MVFTFHAMSIGGIVEIILSFAVSSLVLCVCDELLLRECSNVTNKDSWGKLYVSKKSMYEGETNNRVVKGFHLESALVYRYLAYGYKFAGKANIMKEVFSSFCPPLVPLQGVAHLPSFHCFSSLHLSRISERYCPSLHLVKATSYFGQRSSICLIGTSRSSLKLRVTWFLSR